MLVPSDVAPLLRRPTSRSLLFVVLSCVSLLLARCHCACSLVPIEQQPPRNLSRQRQRKQHPIAQDWRQEVRKTVASSSSIGLLLSATNRRSFVAISEDDNDTNNQNNSSLLSSSSHYFYSRKSLHDPSFYTTSADTINNRRIFDMLTDGSSIQRPSKIQALAWPVLLQGEQNAVVIADQTGSGKTLAYLIPLLQRLLLVKEQQERTSSSARTTRASSSGSSSSTSPPSATAAAPKILILAPTAELADQIHEVCQRLSRHNNSNNKQLFSTVVLSSSGKYQTNIRDQIRLLQQHRKSIDVLISTPGRISTILRTRKSFTDILRLDGLHAVVLDEVDILLLDDTFGPQLETIGQATTTTASNNHPISQQNKQQTQFVFVTATLPNAVIEQVHAQFPTARILKGPGLHRVAPNLKEQLIDVSVPATQQRNAAACWQVKSEALQTALRQNRCQRTLVFCNTVSSCRDVENALTRLDRKGKLYRVLSYHNAMTPEARNANLQAFAADDPDPSLSYILVCTDRAARGVDFFQASVDHVVIFDFPKDPSDYIRRVGRTARAGRSGACTVLAYGWQLPIARSVMRGWKEDLQEGGSGVFVDDRDRNGDGEYRGGVKGRKKRQRDRENAIGGNIATGKLWSD